MLSRLSLKTQLEDWVFFCSLMEIKIAWINLWLFVPAVPSPQTYTWVSEVALFNVCVCVCLCVCGLFVDD